VGFQTKSTTKEIYQYCFKRGKRTIQKNAKEIISNVSEEKGFTVVVVEDESIFIHDALEEECGYLKANAQ
jgi:hypothetical protein